MDPPRGARDAAAMDDRFVLWQAAWWHHRLHHPAGLSIQRCGEPSCREARALLGPPLAAGPASLPVVPRAPERRGSATAEWGGLLERLLELEL